MTTLTLQPDATDGVDTYIQTVQSTLNYGITTRMIVGRGASSNFRALIKFDLTALPSTASISSATLTLQRFYLEGTAANIGIHRALTQWWEGAKDSAAPDAGQDGSIGALRNANGSLAWGAVGGQSGTDWVATATDTQTSADPLEFDLTADVRLLFAGTANYGWWLMYEAEVNGKISHFVSSDNATAADRPKLVVVYTADTLESRVYSIDAETRIYPVDAETRTYAIDAETRVYEVK